jgi:bacillithiol system protein YtxJ
MWSYTNDIDVSNIDSEAKPVLIIKHSNRCSISSVALNRLLESQAELDQRARVILIDVVANRSNSLLLASQLGVDHESPQVIIVKNNEVVYVASHMAIKPNTILPYL